MIQEMDTFDNKESKAKGVIYDELHLHHNCLTFDLFSSRRIHLLTGDSGIGKTYLFRVLREYGNDYAIHAFNKYSQFLLENLKLCKQSLVVIDNADTVLDDELRRYIIFDPNNQYLIIGNDCTGLNLTRDSLVTLRKDGDRIEMSRL